MKHSRLLQLLLLTTTFSSFGGDLADVPNPLMGTNNDGADYSRGNQYPAITVPFGMTAWSPVTADPGSGWFFDFDDPKINAVKATHQPSPWAKDYGSFEVMVMTGALKTSPAERASAFSRENETCKAYHYRAELDDYDVVFEVAPPMLRSTRNRICTESRVSSEFPEALGSQMLQTVDYEYAIYPHAGNWDEAKVYAEADKLNTKPAVTQISINRSGDLPTVASHYAIDNDSLVLSSVNKAEDSEGLIVRLFNPTEETQEGTVKFGLPVSKAWKINMIEKRGERLTIIDGEVSLNLPKGKIVTIEVE